MGGVDIAINRLHAAERLFDDLQSLNYEIQTYELSDNSESLLNEISTRSGEILHSAKTDIVPGGDPS